MTKGANGKRRLLTRENILFTLGIGIIVGEFFLSEVLGRAFHYEFLLAGLALCGVGITQLADRR